MASEQKPGKKNDRRRYRRFATKNRIRFGLIDGTELGSVVAVHDLSEDGLQFSCQDFIRRGILLEIVIEEERESAIRLKGRVVWVQKAPVLRMPNVVGIAFMDLDELTRERLKALGKKRWWFGFR